MSSSLAHPPGQAYVVGGAVRDALLGRPHGDRDWVVVGATPQQMLDAGFLPVGRDFPVFLHPRTHEEYALARTERKTAPGYRGFVVHAAPEVTLEEDLLRRDLTINAMARAADGALIDPCGGQRDLQARVLRHVSAAFAEDPVRILRLARFAARFGDFSVAPETMALMRGMVAAGEVDALVPERVWQELARGLMEPQPQRLFVVLRDCGALARLLPELDRLWGVPQRADYHPEVDTGVHVMLVLQAAVALNAPLAVRWACLMHDLGKGVSPLPGRPKAGSTLSGGSEAWGHSTTPKDVLPRHIGHEQRSVTLAAAVARRLRVPTDCAELAAVVAAEHGNIHRCLGFGAEATLRLLQRCDALRRPERFAQALLACEADHRGRGGDFSLRPYPQRPRLLAALEAARSVDAGAIARQITQQGGKPSAIAQAVQTAREHAVARVLVQREEV
ncbi:MAG: multifunctional CCA addition/repair protein [Burkholderiaceae bacterium]|nr:multifunctional CCA addition/repair protein [Burkholderiaceae bacterium]